jgi:energy-coupling factor transporter ATP-binding protein EcfA2
MFKEFELDLTYKKKISHYVARNDFIEGNDNIHVKKNLIFMGGNASGKTTLGKMLCAIYNYIRGKNTLSLLNSLYDKESSARFDIEFVVQNSAFAFQSTFNSEGLVCEKVYRVEINKNYNIDKLRKALYLEENLISYYSNTSNIRLGFQSYFSINNDKDTAEYFKNIVNHMHYNFSFSEFANDNYFTSTEENNLVLLKELLQNIDPSIEKIIPHLGMPKYNDIEELKTYSIYFKNGDKIEVEDGDISNLKTNRISHGTAEAIYFSALLASLERYKNGTLFVDEKLSHVHSELEIYLISKIIKREKINIQFFYTTHNTDCLDMDIPINCLAFLKRNEYGFNEIVYPEKIFNKNDRKLRNYVQNDFFDTLPKLYKIDNIFENL